MLNQKEETREREFQSLQQLFDLEQNLVQPTFKGYSNIYLITVQWKMLIRPWKQKVSAPSCLLQANKQTNNPNNQGQSLTLTGFFQEGLRDVIPRKHPRDLRVSLWYPAVAEQFRSLTTGALFALQQHITLYSSIFLLKISFLHETSVLSTAKQYI